MMNLRNEDVKEEKWCYDSITLNKKPWQKHVTKINQEVLLTENYHYHRQSQ